MILKKYHIALLLLSLMACCVFGTAQKTKVELTFLDGTTKEGLGKFMSNDIIKFKIDKKSKSQNIHLSKLSKVITHETVNPTTHVYLKVTESIKERRLVELFTGKVSLYSKQEKGALPPGMGGGIHDIDNYYVKKKNEEKATHLGSNLLFTKNFKKAASEYFKDCPDLVTKIQNKEFTKRNLFKMVSFYNHNCQN